LPSTSLICESMLTASDAINNIVEGINMDWSYENDNAFDSIRVKCEFDSNVIDESDSKHEKHFNSIISTWLGIKIDWSNDLENASDSIRVKCEFESNAIDDSDLQFEKHFDPRISTFLGINIDWSDDQKNASDSIRVKRELNSNTIDLSAPYSFLKPNRSLGRSQSKKIIEFRTQACRISILFSAQSVTVLIELHFTTTRRS
jgi:hypothetical protein